MNLKTIRVTTFRKRLQSRLACLLVRFAGSIFPRSKNLWVFGSHGDKFWDNSAHMFVYASIHLSDVKCVWISDDALVVDTLRDFGLLSERKNSFRGLLSTLRAKCFVVSFYSSDINACALGKSRLVNLWHGTPIKRIEWDVPQGCQGAIVESEHRWTIKNVLLAEDFRPELLRRPDLVATGSVAQVEAEFETAFRVPANRIVSVVNPRIDASRHPLDSRVQVARGQFRQVLNRLRPDTMEFVRQLEEMSYVIYAPTYRDFSSSGIHDALVQLNYRRPDFERVGLELVVGMHPASNYRAVHLEMVRKFNWMILPPASFSYSEFFVDSARALITDISSLAFDFFSVQKPVVSLFPDRTEFIRVRGIYASMLDLLEEKSVTLDCIFQIAEITDGSRYRNMDGQTAAGELLSESAESTASQTLVNRIRDL